MKTILFSLVTGTHLRDVLQSDVLPTLRATGFNCVVCTPAADDPVFRDRFEDARVRVERLPPYRITGLEGKIKVMRDAVLIHQKQLRSRAIMVAPRTIGDRPRDLVMRFVGRVMGRSTRFANALARIDERRFRAPLQERLLASHAVDLVVTTSPGFFEGDRPLLRAARARGIPIACLVSSWDNLTSKGAMTVRPDALIVWSEAMRRDAVTYHDFPAARVFVAGVPQFDAYANPRILVSREAFAAATGFHPDEALITFATSPQTAFSGSPGLVDGLVAAIKAGRFHRRCRLLVRLHPKDDARVYERFRQVPEVVMQRAGRESAYLDWEADPEHSARLANTMAHSAVVINVASTMTIDASAFDTPIINIAYDEPAEPRYLHSNRRYYDYIHYRRVVETGGVLLVHSRDQLLDGINRYLMDPSLDREGRRRIVELVAYRIDGQSGKRAAAWLGEMAGVPQTRAAEAMA